MEKNEHIQTAINFSNLIRSTLGPRGMNKMVIDESSNQILFTNDGATIIGSMRGGNPIVELFKNLAHSQEIAIGDGTTTSTIIVGQLLQNALNLINKGIHPTTIINGYNLAKIEAIKFLDQIREEGDKENIIRTCIGTKIPPDIREALVTNLMKIKDFKNLKIHKINFSSPENIHIHDGFVFPGFTINDRMKNEVEGNMAILDFAINWKMDNFSVNQADEMKKVQNLDSEFKFEIVDKLKELGVKCVFVTDTSPEFESYLTESDISAIVIIDREFLDSISKVIGSKVICSKEQINEEHIGSGFMKYEKQKYGNQGNIYLTGIDGLETLVIHAQTEHLLLETMRSVDDVLGLMKNEIDMVIGAGAVEIEVSKYIREFSKKVRGKEQLAVLDFAEAIESIPSILAENCGLDSIDILTKLKSEHEKGKKDFGVDGDEGISDARKRKIFEPVLVKIHAINSATNIANMILKIDNIMLGNMDKKEAK